MHITEDFFLVSIKVLLVRWRIFLQNHDKPAENVAFSIGDRKKIFGKTSKYANMLLHTFVAVCAAQCNLEKVKK